MTNLTKLSENLNLKILNSTETTNLKGGSSSKFKYTPPPKPTKPKPIGGGGGLPPTLDSEMLINF